VVSAQHRPPALKLCLFDSKEDELMGVDGLLSYYKTSLLLEERWKRYGGKVELSYKEKGMHVQVDHWSDILGCLDDRKGDLLTHRASFALPNSATLSIGDAAAPDNAPLPSRLSFSSTLGAVARRLGAELAAKPKPIPKKVYTFWHGTSTEPMSEIVAACLATIKRQVSNAGWELHLLDLDSPEVQLPSSVYPWKDKTDARWVAHLADWIRLDVLERYGGVWLDASIVMLDGPHAIFDPTSNKLQGFELASYNPPGTMENWALAAPAHHPLLTRWRDIFTGAVSQGLTSYSSSLDVDLLGGNCSEASVLAERWKSIDFTSPASAYCRSLKPFMPYLSANAAFRQAVRDLSQGKHLIRGAEDLKEPMAYLARHQTTDFTNRYDSDKAIQDIFGAMSPSDAVLNGVTMLKLRSQERFASSKVGNLSSMAEQGSYLAQYLVDELVASPWASRLGVKAELATAGSGSGAHKTAARRADGSAQRLLAKHDQKLRPRKRAEQRAVLPANLL